MTNKREDRWLIVFLSSIVIFCAALVGVFVMTHCGGPNGPTKVVNGPPSPPPPSPPPPPPAVCVDGSQLGTTRAGPACPTGQTGSITQVCAMSPTEPGPVWVTAANSCITPPAPTCSKATFTADVQPLFTKYCVGCHSAPGKIDTYPVANAWANEISRRISLPTGQNDHMPLVTSPYGQPTAAEISLIKKWVGDGHIQDCSQASRPSFIDLKYVDSVIKNDATDIGASDRPFTRYLLVAHAINAGLSTAELAVWQQAMNKALNGLNEGSQDLFTVQPIDPLGAVWRFDIRNFGFGVADIKAIEKADPVNIVDQTTDGLIIQALLGTAKPWYHADSFVDFTHRNSGLYYQLLGNPANLDQLQLANGVDLKGALASLNAIFVGSSNSLIAIQKNRLLVRVPEARTQAAYWWQSFDVNNIPHFIDVVINGQKVKEDTKNLNQFPLLADTGGAAIYTPDASEVIYTLPNGMQAYFLSDGAGNRLDAAAGNVVRDTASPLSSTIQVGNSCGRCHNAGLIPLQDQILNSVKANSGQLSGNDIAIVERVYKGPDVDNAIFTADDTLFAQTLQKIGVDPLAPDPMSVITDRFLLNWNVNQAASFLLLTVEDFRAAIRTSAIAQAQIGQLLTDPPQGQPLPTVTHDTFIATLPQLIKDARLFQDSIAN